MANGDVSIHTMRVDRSTGSGWAEFKAPTGKQLLIRGMRAYGVGRGTWTNTRSGVRVALHDGSEWTFLFDCVGEDLHAEDTGKRLAQWCSGYSGTMIPNGNVQTPLAPGIWGPHMWDVSKVPLTQWDAIRLRVGHTMAANHYIELYVPVVEV